MLLSLNLNCRDLNFYLLLLLALFAIKQGEAVIMLSMKNKTFIKILNLNEMHLFRCPKHILER